MLSVTRDVVDSYTGLVLKCGFAVSNGLGVGFLEKVYENALAYELQKCGLEARQQESINVFYEGIVVGNYIADIIVAGTVIIELKTVQSLEKVHIAQCINYLKATGLPVCMLLNFGQPRMGYQRVINTDYDIWLTPRSRSSYTTNLDK